MTTPKRLAILPWGNVIEEYLDSIGLRVDAFATQMSGGWLFGYIEALRHADVESVVICFSEGIQEVTRWKNDSTGAEVVGLPASRGLRGARRVVKGLSHWGLDRTSRCVRYLSSHLATPKEALRLQLQEENCDAVLVQEYEDSRFDKVVKVGSRMGLPVFAVFQGGQPRRIPFEAIVRSRSIRRCSGLIIGSAAEMQRVRSCYHLPEAKVARIFNPLDTELWQPDERDETREALGLSASQTVAVWHGRIDLHIKGLDVLIHSWRHVVERAAALRPHLLLVGDGADRGPLSTLLKRLPHGTWTWIDEYVSDRTLLRRYLSAGDLAVLASRREGFPVAPLEAMSCGLPLVATCVAGTHEIVSDGLRVGGVIVPTDDVKALADALVQLICDPGYRNDLAQNARPLITDRVSYPMVGKELARFLGLTGE